RVRLAGRWLLRQWVSRKRLADFQSILPRKPEKEKLIRFLVATGKFDRSLIFSCVVGKTIPSLPVKPELARPPSWQALPSGLQPKMWRLLSNRLSCGRWILACCRLAPA